MTDSGERYEEFAPPLSLRPYVRTIWTYAASAPTGAVQRIAPDGCPELILDIGASYEEQDSDGTYRLQPCALFAGQMTRPMAIRAVGPIEFVAIRFEPDGAKSWLGCSLTAATDKRLDMVSRLKGLCPPPGNPRGQMLHMAEWLEGLRVKNGWSIDPVVRLEIERCQIGFTASLRTPAQDRAMQRRFADHVGISPRMLRSILRFRRVFDHVSENRSDTVSWLEAGLLAGYFDQPQMARDFRRFLGCTATEWAREQVGLARQIASQSYKPEAFPPI